MLHVLNIYLYMYHTLKGKCKVDIPYVYMDHME